MSIVELGKVSQIKVFVLNLFCLCIYTKTKVIFCFYPIACGKVTVKKLVKKKGYVLKMYVFLYVECSWIALKLSS